MRQIKKIRILIAHDFRSLRNVIRVYLERSADMEVVVARRRNLMRLSGTPMQQHFSMSRDFERAAILSADLVKAVQSTFRGQRYLSPEARAAFGKIQGQE